jgi:hypothetical protein
MGPDVVMAGRAGLPVLTGGHSVVAVIEWWITLVEHAANWANFSHQCTTPWPRCLFSSGSWISYLLMLAAEAISHSGSSGDLIHPIDLDRLAHAKVAQQKHHGFLA